jgi:hypothetical protein
MNRPIGHKVWDLEHAIRRNVWAALRLFPREISCPRTGHQPFYALGKRPVMVANFSCRVDTKLSNKKKLKNGTLCSKIKVSQDLVPITHFKFLNASSEEQWRS